jgi:hypothetical protein
MVRLIFHVKYPVKPINTAKTPRNTKLPAWDNLGFGII